VNAHAAEKLAKGLLRDPEIRAAVRTIRREDPRTVEDQVRLASIPAPPFQEAERGREMARLMEEASGRRALTDDAGNVRVSLGPEGPRPLVISAHLDTVFSVDQEIRIRRERDRWVGPGVADDARGLAVLLAVLRTLVRGPGTRQLPIVAVATVGEEGLGDLRGVRHLFSAGGDLRDARAFVSLDGAGSRRVIASGVGSRRSRVTVRGPGGHSWVDWGRVNPIQILAAALAEVERLPLPAGSTFNVGRVGGGTSVNAIPTEAWAEVEVRSEHEEDLVELDKRLRVVFRDVVRHRNGEAARRRPEEAALEVEQIGRRPAGHTDPDSQLVRAAMASTRAVAGHAELATSSTDANYPMHVGIPAITLGAGGEAGMAHTPDEWYRNVGGPDGTLRAYLTLLVLDRMTSADRA
jgi:acetylornithine deacetylase/succinyl-diaminopimelate desuccinylase-like protein